MKNLDIIRIINILIGEKVDYKIRSESLIFLNIFDELLEIHSDTGRGEFFAENPYILKNIMDIFNYILIRTTIIKGWLPEHILLFGKAKELHKLERWHLNRIARNRKVSINTIYQELNLMSGSPYDAQEAINIKFPVKKLYPSLAERKAAFSISHKLVKAIRAKNRKTIITKIVNQALNNKEQFVGIF